MNAFICDFDDICEIRGISMGLKIDTMWDVVLNTTQDIWLQVWVELSWYRRKSSVVSVAFTWLYNILKEDLKLMQGL